VGATAWAEAERDRLPIVDQQSCRTALPKSGNPHIEQAYRTHWIGSRLPPRKDRHIDRPTDAREPDPRREAMHGHNPDNRAGVTARSKELVRRPPRTDGQAPGGRFGLVSSAKPCLPRVACCGHQLPAAMKAARMSLGWRSRLVRTRS
jgi:hypothetical protein